MKLRILYIVYLSILFSKQDVPKQKKRIKKKAFRKRTKMVHINYEDTKMVHINNEDTKMVHINYEINQNLDRKIFCK